VKINLIYDASVTSAPTGFTAAMQTAADIICAACTNAVTLNFRVGWGEISDPTGLISTPLSAFTAEGGPSSGVSLSYAAVKSSLLASATSASDVAAYATLATVQNPNGDGTISVWRAQQKALGITTGGVTANDTGIDGVVGFGTGWSSTQWVRAALHEITHAMGRTSGYPSYGIQDLFRYSAPGVHQYSGPSAAYFSINGGVTDLANFSTTSDYGDWNGDALTATDMGSAFLGAGPNALSAVDLLAMDVIGFKTTASLSVLATYKPSAYMGSDWTALGSSDFNGDGTADILWTYKAGGAAALWTMGSGNLTGFGVSSAYMGSSWSAVSTAGDFNNDGKADLVWVTPSSGYIAIWEMNGSALVGFGVSAAHMGPNWTVAGVGNLNGNGMSDIIWTTANGDVAVWGMSGTALSTFAVSNSKMGAGWTMAGIGDFSGTKHTDLLWMNAQGDVQMWTMSGVNPTKSVDLGIVGSQWHVAGLGDFNADGKQDICFTDAANNVLIWEMNGAQIANTVSLAGTLDATWHLQGVADFTGAGHPNLLWLNNANSTQIWSVG
jgi:hypothetical protein